MAISITHPDHSKQHTEPSFIKVLKMHAGIINHLFRLVKKSILFKEELNEGD